VLSLVYRSRTGKSGQTRLNTAAPCHTPASTFGLLAWIQLPLIFLNRSRLFLNQDRILSRHELCRRDDCDASENLHSFTPSKDPTLYVNT
jgi:hypothetical protein